MKKGRFQIRLTKIVLGIIYLAIVVLLFYLIFELSQKADIFKILSQYFQILGSKKSVYYQRIYAQYFQTILWIGIPIGVIYRLSENSFYYPKDYVFKFRDLRKRTFYQTIDNFQLIPWIILYFGLIRMPVFVDFLYPAYYLFIFWIFIFIHYLIRKLYLEKIIFHPQVRLHSFLSQKRTYLFSVLSFFSQLALSYYKLYCSIIIRI